MQGFDTRHIRGRDLIPISWEMAQGIMKPKAGDGDYCLAVLYVLSPALRIFDAIQQRLRPEGFAAVCTIWRGFAFIIVAMRKRDLPPAEYAGLVRHLTGIDAPRIEDGCVDVWAPVWAMEACREMAVELLTEPDDLAMAA
ncbi:MAG: hypothetical protein ACREA2_22130 [Blastocatellia bacterium]